MALQIRENIDLLARAYGYIQAARLHKKHWSEYAKDEDISLMIGQLMNLGLPKKSLDKLGMAAVRARQNNILTKQGALKAFNQEMCRIIGNDPSMSTGDRIKKLFIGMLHYTPEMLQSIGLIASFV